MSTITPIPTIMVIDDDRVDQLLYRRIITRSGIVQNLRQFYNAPDALDFLRDPERDDISAILLDINMPRMSGFEFLETATHEFGADFAKAIVVMLTTSLNPEDRKRAEKYEAVKLYLNKPLEEIHLLEIARTVGDP